MAIPANRAAEVSAGLTVGLQLASWGAHQDAAILGVLVNEEPTLARGDFCCVADHHVFFSWCVWAWRSVQGALAQREVTNPSRETGAHEGQEANELTTGKMGFLRNVQR